MARRRITAVEKRIVAARQHWRCAHCHDMLAASFEVDHVVPLHLGGEDSHETNAEALCRDCHARKTQGEEVARLKRAHRLRYGWAPKRPPLLCVRCGLVVSPYFAHLCAR